MGSDLYLNYNMNGFSTDTSNLSLFINNGKGIAGDIELNYRKDDIIIPRSDFSTVDNPTSATQLLNIGPDIKQEDPLDLSI